MWILSVTNLNVRAMPMVQAFGWHGHSFRIGRTARRCGYPLWSAVKLEGRFVPNDEGIIRLCGDIMQLICYKCEPMLLLKLVNEVLFYR